MGLREVAEADLETILEDSDVGGGWSVTLTDPDSLSAALTGFTNDISAAIDPDTGMSVTGRTASVVLRISSIYAAGQVMPRGVEDSSSLPWVVTFDDINGSSHTFAVIESQPDRGLGLVTLLLEAYTA